MEIFGRKFTTLQAIGAAVLALPPFLYFLVRVGGDFDFVANLFGWSDWQRDMIDFLISPPGWVIPLYVLIGVSFILMGERRLNGTSARDMRVSIENLEAKQSALSPEAKAIRAKARTEFLKSFIPMLENRRAELVDFWAAAKTGYFAKVKEPMSLTSSHEYPLTQLSHATHSLKDAVQSAYIGQVSSLTWDAPNLTQFPVDGEEIAVNAEKLIAYRSHYHINKQVIENADSCIRDLNNEMSKLNAAWSAFGHTMPRE